jgi:hypothetical protein
MMTIQTRSVFSVLLLGAALTGTSACGQSPLFNHDSAASGNPGAPLIKLTQPGQKDCPLSFPRSGLCASLNWTRQPSEEQTGSFALAFWRAGRPEQGGPYVDPSSDVAVKLWMPAMGHGSSPVKIAHSAAGRFDVTDVYFVMPGDWEIHVLLKNGSNVVDEAVLPVHI